MQKTESLIHPFKGREGRGGAKEKQNLQLTHLIAKTRSNQRESSRVQVHRGHTVYDCFSLMGSTTVAGVPFVCGPTWVDLEKDMWVYLWNYFFQSMTQMWKLCFFIGMAGFYFHFELSPFSFQ